MSMKFRPKTYEIIVEISLFTHRIRQLTYGSTGQSITYVGFSFEDASSTDVCKQHTLQPLTFRLCKNWLSIMF